MSIMLIQSFSTPGFLSGNPVSFTVSPTGSGNLLAILIFGSISRGPVISITDNVGNTYVHAPGTTAHNAFSDQTDIWYALNSISGATTITVTFTSNSGINSFNFVEFSGIQTTAALDVSGGLSNQSHGGGSFLLSPSLTTSNNVELLLAIGQQASDSDVIGVSSPWTILVPLVGGSAYGTSYLVTTSSGTYQANFDTGGSGGNYSSSAAAFFSVPPPLTLNLSDSRTASDVMTDAFGLPLSDSTTASDTAPQAFSVESNAIATVVTPAIETLTNQLLPANIKAYYITEE